MLHDQLLHGITVCVIFYWNLKGLNICMSFIYWSGCVGVCVYYVVSASDERYRDLSGEAGPQEVHKITNAQA